MVYGRGLVVAAAAWLAAAPGAWASTCSQPDPLLAKGPEVVVVGTVTKVEEGGPGGGTNAGANSIFIRPGSVTGTNTATISVGRAYKGAIGDTITVTAELQNGYNLGFSFREGPIFLMAYRAANGTLHANGCGLVRPEQFPSSAMDVDRVDPAKLSRFDRLEYARLKVERAGAALRLRANSIAAAKELSALYRSIGDTERDIALWDGIATGAKSAASLVEFGQAKALAGRHAEAKELFANAIALGAGDDARRLMNRSGLMMGEAVDLREVDLAGIEVPALLATGADFRGRDLTGAIITALDARDADLSGAIARAIFVQKANLTAAKLDEADLSDARLNGVIATGASFRRANLRKAALSIEAAQGADFSGVQGPEARIIGVLVGARFDGADLRKAVLDYVRAGPGLSFRDADLTGASFKNAKLGGADFTNAKLTAVSFAGAIYDCTTVFPDGFDPSIVDGLTIWDGPCPGKPSYKSPDPSSARATCDEACHRWLIADASRSITLSLRSGGKISYAAGWVKPGECAPELTRLVAETLNIAAVYRDDILQRGFCPQTNLPGAAKDRPYFETSLDWNGLVAEIDRAKLLGRARFEREVLPAFQRYVSSDASLRWLTLFHMTGSSPDYSDLFVAQIEDLLSDPDPSRTDAKGGGGGSSKYANTLKIVELLVRNKRTVELLLDGLDRHPDNARTPGFAMLLTTLGGRGSPGNHSTCALASRIEKHLGPWGVDIARDAAWTRTTSLCMNDVSAPLDRALRDRRPEIVSAAIAYWAHLARNPYLGQAVPPPAASATLPALRDALREGKLPASFAPDPNPGDWNPSAHWTPEIAVSGGLLALNQLDATLDMLRAAGKSQLAAQLEASADRWKKGLVR